MSGLITKNELRKELRDEIESKASKQEVNNNTENISTLQQEVIAHKADYATLEKAGHVKAETDADGKLILDIPKSNYNATELPTANDDETKGYSIGSRWVVIITPLKEYVCIDNTAGNAIWSDTTRGNVMLYNDGFVKGYDFEDGYNLMSNINIDQMKVSGHEASSQGCIVTAEPVDISNIGSIAITWGNAGTDTSDYIFSSFNVSKNKMGNANDYDARRYVTGKFNTTTDILDVSNLNGEYYLRFHSGNTHTNIQRQYSLSMRKIELLEKR